MNENKLDICLEKECACYNECLEKMRAGNKDCGHCIFYWLLVNDIEVKNNDGESLTLTDKWIKAAQPR